MKDKADFDVKRKPEQPSTKKLIPVAVPPDTHTHTETNYFALIG